MRGLCSSGSQGKPWTPGGVPDSRALFWCMQNKGGLNPLHRRSLLKVQSVP